ncbi:MAG: hypothetical protein IPJ77_09325 [Planctomycetes bacterium]|nr:hypothetical protein [Planctomycetota bacterium]
MRTRLLAKGASAVLGLPLGARFALEGHFDLTDLGPQRILRLFAADSELPELGPVRIEFEPAGYAPVRRELYCLPARSGLPIWKETLVPRTAAFGEVYVDLSALDPWRAASGGRRGPVGTLHLRPADWGSSVHAVPADAELLELRCVPLGAYRATFQCEPRLPGGAVELGDIAVGEGVHLLTLPASELGAVEVDVFTHTGTRHDGELDVLVETVETLAEATAGGSVLFRHPPYLVAPLRAGAWRISIVDRTLGVVSATVRVRAGATESVALRKGN